MSFGRKYFFSIVLLFSILLVFSSTTWADHPQDGNHDLAEMPADCVGCHNSEGGTNFSVVGEHRLRLGVDNHALCAYCHYNPANLFPQSDPDPDLAVAITFGRRNTNPRGYVEPVYCAYCHVTENRSTHVHVGEHDHAQVPFTCRSCHGNNLKEVHIDPDKNLPTDTSLPILTAPVTAAERAAYDAAYAAGLADLKLACYNCHGDSVTEIVYNPQGEITATNVKFVQDPVVRAAVASGIAGNDVSCDACHADYHSAAHDNTGFPIPQPLSCEACHSGNVVTEHLVNQSLECATCHNSSDPLVIASIQVGQGPDGTYQDCYACHGAADHASAHDHAVLPDKSCNRCHSSAIVTEHAAHGFNDCGICHSNPAYDDIIEQGKSDIDVTCFACHPDAEADHAAAHERIYLKTMVDGVETIITSDDDPVDGLYDNLAAYLPTLTCGGCHKGIAENHWGNFHSGLRVSDLFDGAGNPLPRGELNPARPWITGPGMVGNWCATYNRQLPDLTAAFVDEAEFMAKVDMGIFEFIRECGSCHVGGGPGVENPFGFSGFDSKELDDPVRAAALDTDAANGNHALVPLNAWDFYVENDGSVTRANWAADSGILDVDCFICHLDGYDHLARNTLIRGAARFGQAAAVGAGLATPDETSPDKLDYNTLQVSRDAGNQLYLSHNLTYRIAGEPPQNNCMACHLSSMVVNENQVEKPDQWQKSFYTALALPSLDPENSDPLLAANRKPALYRNDMLKRGTTWRRDEVHKFMECNGCHSRTSKTQAYNPVSEPDIYLHSPGKGYDPLKYPSSVDGTVKLCEDCHVHYGDLDNDGKRDTLAFAPPEMKVYHAQAGLLAEVVPSARRVADAEGNEETFIGSHIDIISCVACHVKKRYAAARSVDYASGVGYYNLVGAPIDQVPGSEMVELAYSWRENGGSKVIGGQPNPDWRRQIFPFNYLTSIYPDNIGVADANGDGFQIGDLNGGVAVVGDPIFQRTVKAHFAYDYINADNNRVASGLLEMSAFDERSEWRVAGLDGNVLFTQGAEIDALQSAMVLSGYMPRLTLEAQPFLVTHNIMPIRNVGATSGWETFALGAPQRDTLGKVVSYGCGDCHGGSGGLFNGSINMLGNGRLISDGSETPITVSWNDAGDVKASAQAWNREGALQEIDFSSGNQTRNPERREFLGYDPARVALLNTIVPADVGVGVDPVAEIVSIGGASALGPPIEIVKGSVGVALVAAAAGNAGSFQYRWNINDVAETLIGQTVTKTFSQAGIWTVRLTVIDEEGRLSQNAQTVNVVVAGPMTQVNLITTPESQAVVLQLSNMPVHDQIKFFFGDGTRQYVSDAVATYTMNRNYRFDSRYLKYYDPDSGIYFNSEVEYHKYYDQSVPEPNVPDIDESNQDYFYFYTTSIQVKNGDDIVEVINVKVEIRQDL